MFFNLPDTTPPPSKEQIEQMQWETWRFESHRFVEYEKGYSKCSFCGVIHNSLMSINDFPLCKKNPMVESEIKKVIESMVNASGFGNK